VKKAGGENLGGGDKEKAKGDDRESVEGDRKELEKKIRA